MKNLSPTDWPVIDIAGQKLTVKWSFHTQFILSKNRVDVSKLGVALKTKAPELIALVMECFAAAVAENYTSKGMDAPNAEEWARTVSDTPDVWGAVVCPSIWAAISKAAPAAKTPTPEVPAVAGEMKTLN